MMKKADIRTSNPENEPAIDCHLKENQTEMNSITEVVEPGVWSNTVIVDDKESSHRTANCCN